jgi:hypothetical protein
MGCYPHFNLAMRSSRGFASTAPDLGRPIQTRFRFGSASKTLNLACHGKSPDHYAKGTPSHCLEQAPNIVLRPLVGMWFQVHVPPLEGVLLIFRSRYWFAIGRQRVLSLAGWAPQIQTDFHVSRPTQVPVRPLPLSSTGLSPSVASLSREFD